MQVIDNNEEMNDFLNDPKTKITDTYLKSICKQGKGRETCKYICLCANGYYCAKKTPMKSTIDKWSTNTAFKAKSDNCEGLS